MPPSTPTATSTRIRRIVLRYAVLLTLAFAAFYVYFYFAQTTFIFHSDPILRADPSAKGWDFEDVRLPVDDETTHGWFIPHENPRGVILFCHGNGGNISNRLDAAAFFRDLGFSVLLFDYGGYGESTGTPAESRVYADARAMWQYLTTDHGVAPENIVIWGRSFGGGAACELATQVTPAAVILESAFLSKPDAAAEEIPWVPWTLLIRHRFANKHKVANIDAPLLIIHSQDDTLFPLHHGRELFARATDPKTFLTVRGDHNDIGRISTKLIRDGANDFFADIQTIGPPPSHEHAP